MTCYDGEAMPTIQKCAITMEKTQFAMVALHPNIALLFAIPASGLHPDFYFYKYYILVLHLCSQSP